MQVIKIGYLVADFFDLRRHFMQSLTLPVFPGIRPHWRLTSFLE